MGGWVSVVLEEGLLSRRPQAVPLGRPLSHLGRQDAGHHTWASGDRSRETTPCTQHIWKLYGVYFLTHLPGSGHLRRRVAGWREPRGFSQVGAVFGPRGKGGGVGRGRRKLGAGRCQKPSPPLFGLICGREQKSQEQKRDLLPCFLGTTDREQWGLSYLLQSAAFSRKMPVGSIPRGLSLPEVPGTWPFPCGLQTHTCSLCPHLR